MALYVFITDSCRADAERHGQRDFLASVKQAIEETQNFVGFSFFLPTPFLKKGLGRSFRLIAYRVPIGNDELILFLRVLARGSNEYEYFLANWEEDTASVTARFQPFSDDELRRIHAEVSRIPTAPPPAEPSDKERAWLYEVFRQESLENELFVLETEEWVRKMKAQESRDFLALYHQTLEQMDPAKLHVASANTDCQVFWETNKRLGVAYLYRPSFNRLLLLEPLRRGDDVYGLLERHRSRLAKATDGQHELSRMAARAYPFLMVLDQDAWLAIQKDEEANLALSPEEAEVLGSVHGTGGGTFPLFINGRAGSGKSTMLQYLVAEYVDFALRNETVRLPLYMTCSIELLERARDTVRGLLVRHHRRLLEGVRDPARVNSVLDRVFVVFHEFLCSLLPPERQKDFPHDRYVDYAAFRRLWTRDFARRPEARRLSLDVSWHTIRTYIKGMRSVHDDDLGPDEFKSVPRRRRSVSEDTYEQIYQHVWCRWYKRLCAEMQYWDDQDLAAAVIASGSIRHTDRPTVFCDEAQDFTPIELDIIFQLSLFGRRSLRVEEVARVPIVFAGDPLQTINPTGFKWETVQAEFHERFSAVLDPRRRARVNINYKELCFNYRSNPGIVNFCNLIQLVRAAVLGARDIRPQEAWWVDAPVQTVWFAADDLQTEQQLVQHPELVKLVNCEQGEESDYVREDPILKNLKEEAEGIYRNVLSPTRAKGLEFPAVVLYRFGETAPKDFADLLNGHVDLTRPETRLPYEYFFNRLYVAASRAKGQLVIVDSTRALREFWRFASDMEMIDALMERAGGKSIWQNYVTYLVPGNEGAWAGECINPREQAEEYRAQGRLKRDPYLLRQAALAYRSAGDRHEAGKCLAHAAELEAKYQDAGNRYRELGLHEDAFRCFWVGQKWDALCDLAACEPALTSRLETRAADFMTRTKVLNASFLSSLVDAVGDEAWLKVASSDLSWCEVLTKLVESLSRAAACESISWANVYKGFQSLRYAGITFNEAHLAMVAYRAGDLAEAVSLWEQSGSIERAEYRQAKARLTPFPEKVKWLGRLNEYGEIIRQWREHYTGQPPIEKLDDEVVWTVADAALAERELPLATELMEGKPDWDRVAKLIAAGLQAEDERAAIAGAVLAMRLLVRRRAWDLAIRAAEDSTFADLTGVQQDALRSMLRKTGGARLLFEALIQELASSEDLVSETVERKATVAEFLHRHFISRGSSRMDRASVPPELAGAAIERAGKIVDALQFYENLERNGSTEASRKFAAERSIRNLERYAEYLQSRKDEAEAQQRRARARAMRERYGLPEHRTIPDYPVLRMATAPVAPTETIKGPFKITVSRAHARLRIEHRERFETVTVDGKERSLLGDATFSRLDSSIGHPQWQIEGWDTTIGLRDRDNVTTVVVEYLGERFEIELA